VINPVQLIDSAKNRLARIAAVRIGLYGALPLVVTIALAVSVNLIGTLIWRKLGYFLDATRATALREAILGLAGAEIVVVVLLAWRAWRRADDFVGAAQLVDDLVGAHQEILTLATVADPAHPDAKQMRTPLFPMLWRRTISYLDMFDPRREFRLEFGGPLKGSSAFALAVVVLLGFAMLALVRPPTPIQAAAYRLREFAAALGRSGTTPADGELAEAAREVASHLEDPKLPPEQKKQELEALKRQLEKFDARKQTARSGSGKSGGSNGSGEGNGSGNGTGQGAGKGAGGTGEGGGAGNGGKGPKSTQQTVELRNDISKAQAKLEQESKSGDKSKTVARKNDKKGTGRAPKSGENPNQAGPQNKPNGTGDIPMPQPGNLAQNKTPSGTNPNGRKDAKGSQGDTHLGEMPKAASYERFYKPGEKGPPIDIRDARYVTFRLPTEIVSAGGDGRTVRDSTHPTAETPYTNAPLKEQRLAVSPDERQLVPPRYRELLR
jgi:hypothetical protein